MAKTMYVVDTPTTNSYIKLVKYADDTVIMELLSDEQPSELSVLDNQIVFFINNSHFLYWFHNHYLS